MKYLLTLTLFLLPLLGNAENSIDDFSVIAHWTCDETSGIRYDSSSNNNDLTDNNTVLYATGLLSNACDFESTNSEYLNISDANQSGLDLASDFTISAWVKFETVQSQAVIYKWAGGSASYGLYYVDDPVDNWRLNIYPDGNNNYALDFDYTMDTTNWKHICIPFDLTGNAGGEGFASLYVNGTLQSSTNNANITGIFNGTGPTSLSSLSSGVQWYFDGLMDEVTVFSGTLTGTQCATLYNSGTPLPWTATNPATSTPTTTSASSTSSFDDDNIVFMLAIISFFLAFLWIGFIFNGFRKKA